MPRIPIKTLTPLASTARTTSSDSGTLVFDDNDWQNMVVKLNVTAASGTSPTLDVYVQQSLDGGTTFLDVYHFAQQTAAMTNPAYVTLASGGDNRAVTANGDAVIAANSFGIGPISNVWKVKYVIAGTTPSFTFQVDIYRS